MINIYRNGTVIKKVHPSDSDKVTKKVMGENTLSLSFDLTSPFIFAMGDYCFFNGEKYTLNVIPKIKKSSSNLFEYDMVLEGVEYELRKVQHLFYTANLEFTGGSDFSLMGDAELHARVIVENLNRVQSGWTLGDVIESDVKNLTFSSNNCLEAITKIAEEFGAEYWIGSDKTVNIGRRGDILPITFEYGYKKGLYKLERDNVNSKDVITRLYPFGSTSNLIKGYRNNAKRLQISTNYIEKNVDKYGVIESSEIFEEIKPERTGTITGVGDIFTFSDSAMDFDLNEESGGNTLYLIPGTTAKIHFQTGDLAGYEFELYDYNHATKTFKVNKFTNEVAYDLPNPTLKPRVGDKYIILDIYMPQSYVDAAEARLLAKAQESINQNSEPNVSYKCEIDPIFIKNLGLIPKQGDYVSLLDDQLGVDRGIRIVSLTRNVNNPNKIDIDLADTIEPSLESRIETTLQNQNIVIKINKLNDPARARRNYKVVQELQNAIFDNDGYFEPTNIKPLSIETSMLSVGSKWNNFYIDGLFEPNYLAGVNNFKYSGGTLSHFAIDGTNQWIITNIQETIADNNLRYIYAFCDKDASTGYIVISTEKLSVDGDDNWQFLVGVLSSVMDGARNFTPTFGNSTFNGRFIKTGRISSNDEEAYFDLNTKEIAGDIRFKNDVSGRVFQVGPENNPKAGMSGVGNEETDVRFWAGANYGARDNAPFRVLQNGKMFAFQGEIAGWTIDNDRLISENGDEKLEINSIDQLISFSHADEKNIIITTSDLPTLQSLVTPLSGNIYPQVNDTHIFESSHVSEDYSSLSSNSFVLPSCSFTIRVKLTANGRVSGVINAYLADESGNILKVIGITTFSLYEYDDLVKFVTFKSLYNGGTCKLLLEYTLDGYEDTSFTIGGSVNDDCRISYTQQKIGIIIGKNGIANYFSSNKYLYANSLNDYYLTIKGKQKFISEGATYLDILGTGIKASRLNMCGMILNMVTKSANYTISASDIELAGVKVIGANSDITITLPDLNAYETINGVNFYYNDNRVILILNSDRYIYVAAKTYQKVKGSYDAFLINRVNTGYMFIGDKATANWMPVAIG